MTLPRARPPLRPVSPSDWRGRRGGILKHLLIPLVVAAAVLALAWMLLLPALLSQKLEQASGIRLDPGRLMANPVSGRLRITDATLSGPEALQGNQLPDSRLLDIARLETTVRPWHLRQRPLQIPRLVLDIKTLHVVIAPDGRTNLALGDQALARLSGDARPSLNIQSLELFVERITVTDYSRGRPEPRRTDYTPHYRRTHTQVTAWEPLWRDALAAARR